MEVTLGSLRTNHATEHSRLFGDEPISLIEKVRAVRRVRQGQSVKGRDYTAYLQSLEDMQDPVQRRLINRFKRYARRDEPKELENSP